MKANQRLNKSHKYLLTYTKKVWKKSKKLKKARKCPGPTRPAARIVKPDPTRARIFKTRPDPNPLEAIPTADKVGFCFVFVNLKKIFPVEHIAMRLKGGDIVKCFAF